jgi:hypothetical protein
MRHESESDRVREKKSIAVFLDWKFGLGEFSEMKLTAHKLYSESRYPVDFYVADESHTRHEPQCWAEVKGRQLPAGQPFKTWGVGLFKMNSGIRLAESISVPFYLVYAWSNLQIWTLRVTRKLVADCEKRWCGNFARGNPEDEEPWVMFPRELFTHIGKIDCW